MLDQCDPDTVSCPACSRFIPGCSLCGKTERVPLWLAIAFTVASGVWTVRVERARGRTCVAKPYAPVWTGTYRSARRKATGLWYRCDKYRGAPKAYKHRDTYDALISTCRGRS